MSAKKIQVTAWALRCGRCGHGWRSFSDHLPLRCPGCKSPYWNTPRTRKPKAR